MDDIEPLRRRIENHLLTLGGIEQALFSNAAQIASRTKRPVEQVLNQLGSLTDQGLVDAYAHVADLAVWDTTLNAPLVCDRRLRSEFLRRARVIQVHTNADAPTFAACDPLDTEVIDGLSFAMGEDVTVLAARPSDWRREFERLHPEIAVSEEPDEQRLSRAIDAVDERGADSAGGRLVAAAFEAAVLARASDIHFEPNANSLVVRFRVDGRLSVFRSASLDVAAAAVSRIKVIAGLDLGERRLPQDGRTTFVVAGRQIDVRVAVSPTVFGESAVMRILDRSSVPLDLKALGLSDAEMSVLATAAALPNGLFLVSGPTGSGKTTTLYALLQTLSGSNRKILSVEDPVEFHFEHVTQTQVAPQLGLTFARALRSFLRQDPDVILVGEIRDPETAAVAMQAAMTGHLVLASIHANDALGVIPRLLDMKIEPYQLKAALKGASAQRLVRRLCPHCASRHAITEAQIAIARDNGVEPPAVLAQAAGCQACGGTGFRGRLAISEAFMATDAQLRSLVSPDESHGREVGATLLRRSLVADGLLKANALVTTYEEVLAAVSD